MKKNDWTLIIAAVAVFGYFVWKKKQNTVATTGPATRDMTQAEAAEGGV